MIEFMVLSAPRSGSTWASNWLTTERTLCLHDPILEHLPEDLDKIPSDRMLGIACTGLALLPDVVNRHPARKVIVHRDLVEVDRSLESIGLSRLGPRWYRALDRLAGLHVYYSDLFDPMRARNIWDHLVGPSFDEPRHALLRNIYVEPNFEKVPIHAHTAKAFRERLTAALS